MVRITSALILAAASTLAAQQTLPRPEQNGGAHFDVVSIKPEPNPRGAAWGDRLEKGRWLVNGAIPPSIMLSVAFGTRNGQIQGIPDWATKTAFTIDARADGDYTQDQFREMVRNMLRDRFHFAYHLEDRPVDVNVLSVAKGGAKLKLATAPCLDVAPNVDIPDGQVRCGFSTKREMLDKLDADGRAPSKLTVTGYSVSMQDLAKFMPIRLWGQIPVIDQTGIAGKYDLTLSYEMIMHIVSANSPPPAMAVPSEPVITFPEVMKSAWGLEITPKKLPLPTVIVDHLEMPTAN